MPRYINADKLEELCNIMADKCGEASESIWNQFSTVVELSPTVELVDVERGRTLGKEEQMRDPTNRHTSIDARKKDFKDYVNWLSVPRDDYKGIMEYIDECPSEQSEWNNHTVACLLADIFGDVCACNFNGIDGWLPEKCELRDACPHPAGVACWEQFLKHREMRPDDDPSHPFADDVMMG